MSKLAEKLGDRSKEKAQQDEIVGDDKYPAEPLDKSMVMPTFGMRSPEDVVLRNLPLCSEAIPRETNEDGTVHFDLPYVRGRWNEEKGHWEAIDYSNYKYEDHEVEFDLDCLNLDNFIALLRLLRAERSHSVSELNFHITRQAEGHALTALREAVGALMRINWEEEHEELPRDPLFEHVAEMVERMTLEYVRAFCESAPRMI